MTRIGGGKPPVERAPPLSTLFAVFCRTVLPDALSRPSGGAGHACPVSESPGIIRSDSGRPALAGGDDMASRYPRFDTPPAAASFCCGGLHFGSAAVRRQMLPKRLVKSTAFFGAGVSRLGNDL